MGTRHKIQVVVVIEGLYHVAAKQITGSSWRNAPAFDICVRKRVSNKFWL
jgi:hypothetical protein